MRIIWITPGFPADENDHNCIPPLQLLARALVQQGVDLQIIALEYPFRRQPYRWHGIPVWPCDGRNRRWLKWRTFWRAHQLGQARLDEAPAVVHSFWLGLASLAGRRLALRRHVPHCTTLMGQDALAVPRLFAPSAETRLVVLSDFHRAALAGTTGRAAAHVIPWGVDEGEILADFSQNRPLDVLGVGSLLPVKDWTSWLRVIRLAASEQPGLQAELIGDGPERQKLERLVIALNLEKNVRFTGPLPRPAVLEKMRQAKVLLHTARFESFGFVLAEAAMCGCRTVSTPVGIAPSFDFTAKTEQELAEKLLAALAMPVRREALAPFTMQATAEAYRRLYAGIS